MIKSLEFLSIMLGEYVEIMRVIILSFILSYYSPSIIIILIFSLFTLIFAVTLFQKYLYKKYVSLKCR